MSMLFDHKNINWKHIDQRKRGEREQLINSYSMILNAILRRSWSLHISPLTLLLKSEAIMPDP